MDHGFETEIGLSGANDLSDILGKVSSLRTLVEEREREEMPYAGVVGFKESNFDAFVLEVALGLSKVERGVVWRSVPGNTKCE